jgi:hypothetical protein
MTEMPTDGVPVLDLAQLARRTMGDDALQVEVLSLFATEVERLLRQVEVAPDPQVRVDRLHAMISLARGIGAQRLAQEARLLRTRIAEEEPDLEPLRATIEATLVFVRRAGV